MNVITVREKNLPLVQKSTLSQINKICQFS